MKTKIFCDIADYKTIKYYNNKSIVDGFTYESKFNEISWSKNYKNELSKNFENLCKKTNFL